MRANLTIMIDPHSGIEDDVITDTGIGLHDHSCHDLHPLPQVDTTPKNGAGVNQRGKTVTEAGELCVQALPQAVAWQAAGTVGQLDIGWRIALYRLIVPQNRDITPSLHALGGKARITDTQHLAIEGLEEVQHYLGMATCPQQNNRELATQIASPG